jgi:hypothetical protein
VRVCAARQGSHTPKGVYRFVGHAWGRCGGPFSRFRAATRNRVFWVRKGVPGAACIQRFGEERERVR